MKVIEITRTVSGIHYDNVSAIAQIEEGDNLIEAFKSLDFELHKALHAISEQANQQLSIQSEKRETVSLLKKALEFAEKSVDDIPF